MLEAIITLLLQSIAFGLVYYFSTWVATKKFQKDLDRLENGIWCLLKATKHDCQVKYEENGKELLNVRIEPCLTDTKDEDSCD